MVLSPLVANAATFEAAVAGCFLLRVASLTHELTNFCDCVFAGKDVAGLLDMRTQAERLLH